MLKPVFSSIFSAFIVTAALSAATEQPNTAEQQRILDKLRHNASRYLENLPNFVCSRVTEQYQAGKKPEKWKQRDTLQAKLIFNQGKENQTLELVNGKPVRPGHFVNQPLETAGEFGDLVSKVLDANTSAQISWNRWEELGGHQLAVFEYMVDQQHSTLSVGLGGVATTVPYRGLIYADPETGQLWRITSSPFDIPAEMATKSVTTVIDYGPVDIGNRHFVLPVTASVLLDTGEKNILNKVSFNQYRKFEVEAKITFVSGSN